MVCQIDIKKKLHTHTDRVKAVDIHPSEPWVLTALYSGHACIYDYSSQSLVRSVEASNLPLRAGKFIPTRQCLAVGGDDLTIKIFSSNTMEKLYTLEGHTDYIRSLAVHASQPYMLSSSDDMTIILWQTTGEFNKCCIFEQHTHYVMEIKWHPREELSFASASLDKSIKMWAMPCNVGTSPKAILQSNYTLIGHTRGVNCIDFSSGCETAVLISGSDDNTVRIWDIQTKQCIHVLEGHTKNIASVLSIRRWPIIISGGEDGTIKIWHSTTYRNIGTTNHLMGRVWSLSASLSDDLLAIGTDEGTIVTQIGGNRCPASMHGGKIVFYKNSELRVSNAKMIDLELVQDGKPFTLLSKDVSPSEIFPKYILHQPSGRFLAIVGDGEYIIFTAQAFRSKAFGKAEEFIWAYNGQYAIRQDSGRIVCYKNFESANSFRPSFTVTEIFGGRLLGLKTAEFICFYDWDENRLIRRIDVSPNQCFWDDGGNYLILACEESFFLLSFDQHAVSAAITANAPQDDEGIPIAFELLQEVKYTIITGIWIEVTFIFVTNNLQCRSLCGNNTELLATLTNHMTILGYLPETSRLYLMDHDMKCATIQISLPYLRWQAAALINDQETMHGLFANIPENLHDSAALFVEKLGHTAYAFEIAKKPEHRIRLGKILGHLDMCANILQTCNLNDSINHWKDLGDAAIEQGRFTLAAICYRKSADWHSLLFLGLCIGSQDMLQEVLDITRSQRIWSIAFQAAWILADLDTCVEILLAAGKYGEAAIFSRIYAPSLISCILPKWKSALKQTNPSLSETIADPAINPELFPELEDTLTAEKAVRLVKAKGLPSATKYWQYRNMENMDLVAYLKLHSFDELVNKLMYGENHIPDIVDGNISEKGSSDQTSSVSIKSNIESVENNASSPDSLTQNQGYDDQITNKIPPIILDSHAISHDQTEKREIIPEAETTDHPSQDHKYHYIDDTFINESFDSMRMHEN